MAREAYSDDQSINSMTTRQLRQYISDKATEAQARLDSSDMEEATRAFKNMANAITYAGGTKVRRSTSNMTREEMVEYAYDLRQFNSMDDSSGFAQSIEWKENKSRYESFIRNRIEEGDEYWKQYLTPKGNVSKKGYQDYKDYINFIKSIKDIQMQYGYRTLKQYGIDAMGEGRTKEVAKVLNEVYQETKGKGFSQRDLIEAFEIRLANIEESKTKAPNAPKRKQTATRRKPKNVKIKTERKKSKSNITTKKPKGMKGESIRERIN